MTTNPLVSILCPVFNGEKYFDRAVPSILNQTYENFEFIIINDGSTDGTKEFLDNLSLKDSRVKVFHPGRLGFVNALNFGITKCSGEYIARQDFDDISYPERIEKQLEYLLKNPDISWLGAYGKSINEMRGEEKISKYPLSHKKIVHQMAISIPWDHTLLMFKKQAVLKVGGYPPMDGIEDLQLGINLASQGFLLQTVPVVLGSHIEHQDSFFNTTQSYKHRQELITKVQISAIKLLKLPKWMYIYPLGRKFYYLLPDTFKKLLRKIAGGNE
jgi:glycosyltransferase EpsE